MRRANVFFHLLGYIFLTNLLLDDRFLKAILAIIVAVVLVSALMVIAATCTLLATSGMRAFASTATVVASTLEVGCIVDIHFLLIIINTETFLLVGVGIGIFTVLRFVGLRLPV